MSELEMSVEEEGDASRADELTFAERETDNEAGIVGGAASEPQVLITEQEVMFGTAATLRPRPTTIIGRCLIGAVRVVGAALRPPPPRRQYYHRYAWLEHSAMSREMDRL